MDPATGPDGAAGRRALARAVAEGAVVGVVFGFVGLRADSLLVLGVLAPAAAGGVAGHRSPASRTVSIEAGLLAGAALGALWVGYVHWSMERAGPVATDTGSGFGLAIVVAYGIVAVHLVVATIAAVLAVRAGGRGDDDGTGGESVDPAVRARR